MAFEVLVVSLRLRFPEASSLKAKRQILRSAKDKIQQRLHVVLIDHGPQDSWQLASLGLVGAVLSEAEAMKKLEALRALLLHYSDLEVLSLVYDVSRIE